MEALKTVYGYPQSAAACSSWVSSNSLQHMVVRDQGGAKGIEKLLAMQTYDVIVMDRRLKIVYRGSLASASVKTQVLSTVATLK